MCYFLLVLLENETSLSHFLFAKWISYLKKRTSPFIKIPSLKSLVSLIIYQMTIFPHRPKSRSCNRRTYESCSTSKDLRNTTLPSLHKEDNFVGNEV